MWEVAGPANTEAGCEQGRFALDPEVVLSRVLLLFHICSSSTVPCHHYAPLGGCILASWHCRNGWTRFLLSPTVNRFKRADVRARERVARTGSSGWQHSDKTRGLGGSLGMRHGHGTPPWTASLHLCVTLQIKALGKECQAWSMCPSPGCLGLRRDGEDFYRKGREQPLTNTSHTGEFPLPKQEAGLGKYLYWKFFTQKPPLLPSVKAAGTFLLAAHS